MGDVLEQHRLAGTRRRDDQAALTLAEGGDDVDDAGGTVLQRRIVDFHLELRIRVERRQIVEMDLVARLVRALEIDRRDLQQREIAFAVLGAADFALDRVAGPQREAADLRGRDVDIVGTRQVVRFRRAQEAEAVRQHFHHALADDVDTLLGILLQDREHHVLRPERRGVLDLEFFRERQKVGRGFGLEVLQLDLRHRLDRSFSGGFPPCRPFFQGRGLIGEGGEIFLEGEG